jgi:tight adherence protein B
MDPGWIRALFLVLTFAAVLLAVEALLSAYLRSRGASQAINQRMSMIGSGVSRAETMSRLRRQEGLVIDRLPLLLQGPGRRLERTLMAAGMTMPTGQILLTVLLAPVVLLAFFVTLLVLSGSSLGMGRFLLLAVFALALGFGIPLLILQARAARRRKKMQEQFPVALDVFVRGLRAGHPVAAALDLLTVEMPDPIGSQFGLVVDEVTYGADLRDALADLAERWDLDDMRMFVVSLSVQQETGGNLAEILENLSKVIRERTSLFLKVRALSSEGRMTAIMLTVLPVLAFTGLFLFNPAFYLDVADDSAFVPGFVGLLLLYGIGVFTIRRMVDLKV